MTHLKVSSLMDPVETGMLSVTQISFLLLSQVSLAQNWSNKLIKSVEATNSASLTLLLLEMLALAVVLLRV